MLRTKNKKSKYKALTKLINIITKLSNTTAQNNN